MRQAAARLHVVGVHADRALIKSHRFADLGQLFVDHAQFEPRFRIGGRYLQDILKFDARLLVVAGGEIYLASFEVLCLARLRTPTSVQDEHRHDGCE